MPRKHVPWAKRDAANDVVERSPAGLRRYEMEMWLLQNPGAAKEEQTPFCPFLLGTGFPHRICFPGSAHSAITGTHLDNTQSVFPPVYSAPYISP
jgi:hypothetical protein